MSMLTVALIVLLKTIPIGGEGRWDYICVDSTAQRLYIPRSTHVQILDLEKGTVVGDIPNTNGVHGVGWHRNKILDLLRMAATAPSASST